MTDISTLFRPATLGALDIPNRILMAPLTRNRAHSDGTPWKKAQIYYGQRASAGLIVSEATQITPRGKGYLDTPGLHAPRHVEAWRKITDAVHARGGRIFSSSGTSDASAMSRSCRRARPRRRPRQSAPVRRPSRRTDSPTARSLTR